MYQPCGCPGRLGVTVEHVAASRPELFPLYIQVLRSAGCTAHMRDDQQRPALAGGLSTHLFDGWRQHGSWIWVRIQAENHVNQNDGHRRILSLLPQTLQTDTWINHRVRPALSEPVLAQINDRVAAALGPIPDGSDVFEASSCLDSRKNVSQQQRCLVSECSPRKQTTHIFLTRRQEPP